MTVTKAMLKYAGVTTEHSWGRVPGQDGKESDADVQ